MSMTQTALPAAPASLCVLVSGNGSNLQAILDACASGQLNARVSLVISNRSSAFALQRAATAGVPTTILTLKSYRDKGRTRAQYDEDLATTVLNTGAQLIVLAGFMHVLSADFLRACPRVINLHPALPGAFPGTHAIQRAHDAFHKGEIAETGIMVHWVVPEVDAGRVIAQEAVSMYKDESLEELEMRIHGVEHRLIVEGIAKALAELDSA